ncbi:MULTISPECIES: hypothetical protein [Vibrio]|uniref:hypothetical protein n=1 Tax=Vibrio TaxID=662 RepID=UPI000E32A912|nr:MULTISPECIES: hypothetical protein [Vibrio]MCA2474674.1 hypothetical protein [Vibrio alginolyticus]HAT8517735.1 hypothetical protein [Vibrio vulnificus]MBE4205067.1 hypothetical protein [Vibrio parahaemolyticus]MDG2757070.1 hypothetical protein [Vibrio parahaemolyticus]MDW2154701.1 hypothetical protein [Vibrio sp. 2092]
MDNAHLELHDKFITKLQEVVDASSDNLCAMIQGLTYSIDAPLDEIPSPTGDRYTLQASLCQGGDGGWEIVINAVWSHFGRMPLAYLRTKHSFYQSKYRFEQETDRLLGIFEQYSSLDIKNIVQESITHINKYKAATAEAKKLGYQGLNDLYSKGAPDHKIVVKAVFESTK